MEMCYVSKGIDNFIEVSLGCGLLKRQSPQSFRLRMLENNDIAGLIRPVIMEMDGQLTLKYNTCSCYVLDRFFLKFKPDGGFLQIIMSQLEGLISNLREYLLEPDDLVLKPEYMFYNWGEKALRLIYVPGYGQSLKIQLKGFFEYIMRIFDHRDEAGVRYMYGLYDLIAEDTFSMEDFRLPEEGDMDEPKQLTYPAKTRAEEITKLVPLTSGALKEIVLSKYDEMVLIGRGKRENDYRIPTTQISRVHACIYIRSNGIYVEDRESTNGTFVNAVRLEPLKQQLIQVGDLVNFANEEFFAV